MEVSPNYISSVLGKENLRDPISLSDPKSITLVAS